MARPWRCVEDRRLEENPGKCDTLFDVNHACMVKYARAEVRNTFFCLVWQTYDLGTHGCLLQPDVPQLSEDEDEEEDKEDV